MILRPRGRPSCPLPGPLEERRRLVERALGRPVVVKQIRTQDPRFRGRLHERGGTLLIECQAAAMGYFWDVAIIEELLFMALSGKTEGVRRDDTERSPAAR